MTKTKNPKRPQPDLPKLPRSSDARDWAEGFVQMVNWKPSIATDEATMCTWFACAIMAGYDEAKRGAALIPAVQEFALKHRITDLEDEELFIGAKLMGALGWTGRTATLDEIVAEVLRLRKWDGPRRHSLTGHAYLRGAPPHTFQADPEEPMMPQKGGTKEPICYHCGQIKTHKMHGGAKPNAR